MRQFVSELEVRTPGRGFTDITGEISRWVSAQGVEAGLATVFLKHTSASLLIQENADPAVLADLADALARLAPESRAYRHQDEGPDDMPAHLRAALTLTSLTIPVLKTRLALGTWQAIYLWEHRTAPHRRTLALHLLGE